MDFLKKASDAASSAVETVTGTVNDNVLDEKKIAAALTEALQVATEKAVSLVSVPDGFLSNKRIRVPVPKEIEPVHSTLIKLPGFDGIMEEFEVALNRAAEVASKEAKEIFAPVIAGLTFEKAVEILNGAVNAATEFFEACTRKVLYAKFLPIVKERMHDVGLVTAWEAIKEQVAKIPLLSMPDFDLNDYVTTRALDGLFVMLGLKEGEIRQQPAARVTPLLSEVFKHAGNATAAKK